MCEAVLINFAKRRALEEHGLKMLNRDFQPGATLATQLKNLGTVLDVARHYGAALPLTEQVTATFRTSAQAGQSQPGHSDLVLHLKQLRQPARSPT